MLEELTEEDELVLMTEPEPAFVSVGVAVSVAKAGAIVSAKLPARSIETNCFISKKGKKYYGSVYEVLA